MGQMGNRANGQRGQLGQLRQRGQLEQRGQMEKWAIAKSKTHV